MFFIISVLDKMILTVSICVRLQVGSCCLELNPWVTSLGFKWGKRCRACSKQFCWCLQVRGRLSSTVLSLSQINKTGKPCDEWSKSAWKELRTGADRAPAPPLSSPSKPLPRVKVKVRCISLRLRGESVGPAGQHAPCTPAHAGASWPTHTPPHQPQVRGEGESHDQILL